MSSQITLAQLPNTHPLAHIPGTCSFIFSSIFSNSFLFVIGQFFEQLWLFNGQVEDFTAVDFFYALNGTEHGSQPSLTSRVRELFYVLEVRIEPGDLNQRPPTPQSVTLPTIPRADSFPYSSYAQPSSGNNPPERERAVRKNAGPNKNDQVKNSIIYICIRARHSFLSFAHC